LGGLLLFHACMVASPTQDKHPSPYFLSEPNSYRVEVGGSVLLKCAVENLGESTLIWKKDGRMISAGGMVIRKDPRMVLVGTSLRIDQVSGEDAGEYLCNVETFGAPLDQAHTLDILIPPTLHVRPDNRRAVVRSGSTISLECRAEGNPPPSVTWTRLNSMLPSGEKTRTGSFLVIDQVTRKDGGLYTCSGANGVGEEATAQIHLHVLYPPEIEIEQSWLESRQQGIEAEVGRILSFLLFS